MDKFEFDRTIVVSIVTGVIVIVMYDYLRAWLEIWFTHAQYDEIFLQQLASKTFAGGFIALGAFGYFIISALKYRRKKAPQNSSNTVKKQHEISSDKIETKSKRKWKEILIVVLILIIIVETVGLLTKPVEIFTLDYELFKQVLIVIIPIIGSAISAYKITNSWQIRRDKIEMKKTVLIAFKDSAKKVYNIQENFAMKLVSKYGTVVNKDKLIENGTLEIAAKTFPTDVAQQPLLCFTKEYHEAQEDLIKARYDGSHFLTLLVLYYKNDLLKEKYLNLQRYLRDRWLTVEKMTNSTNESDFVTAANEYHKKTEQVRELLNDLEESLVTTSLYNIPT